MSVSRLLIFRIDFTNNASAWLTGRFNSSCGGVNRVPKEASSTYLNLLDGFPLQPKSEKNRTLYSAQLYLIAKPFLEIER